MSKIINDIERTINELKDINSTEEKIKKISKQDFHFRITDIDTYILLHEILARFNVKRVSQVLNEALRFGMPIYKEHLETEGGKKPASDPKFEELKVMVKQNLDITEKLKNLQKETHVQQLIINAQLEIMKHIISSIYSRQKLAWDFEQGYPELSKESEDKMDDTIPAKFEKMFKDYMAVLDEELEGDDE